MVESLWINFDGGYDRQYLESVLEPGDIVVAEYQRYDYEGNALAYVFRGEKILEADASHCSCNGLEDLGALTPVTSEYVRLVPKAQRYSAEFNAALNAALDELHPKAANE